ncbi:Flap endonuclease 1 [Fusarium oxysporum f. sp. albedinis]|nr:Flap endonuclease 1 [Fusarium oxysporum f. sp. albedinis]
MYYDTIVTIWNTRKVIEQLFIGPHQQPTSFCPTLVTSIASSPNRSAFWTCHSQPNPLNNYSDTTYSL